MDEYRKLALQLAQTAEYRGPGDTPAETDVVLARAEAYLDFLYSLTAPAEPKRPKDEPSA